MKFIDLFCGIGGFRWGMEQAGHECVWSCEIDRFARRSYEAIFGSEPDGIDIRMVTDESIRGIGTIDCICGGFPCQSFSIAGKRGGFDDTRGTLFFEIMRFANILRPSYLFLENVEGLLSHDEGNTFETILRTLDEGGGMMRNGTCLTLKITESRKIGSASSLSDILEIDVHEKYFLSDEKTQTLLKSLA